MKLLFLSEAVSLAHFGRPLILAEWALKNGAEVHFASSAQSLIKTNISVNGIKSHTLFTINEKLFYSRINQGSFFYKTSELKKYVAEELALIKKVKPDLIISDFRLTASISAELSGKPLLNLSNSYWSPHYACPFPAPESGIFKYLPLSTTNLIFNFVRPFAFKYFGKELNQTRKFYGLKTKNDFREHYTDGTFTGYMDLPNFVNLKKLPVNHFFLGPIIWSPKTNGISQGLKDKNNVYVSMGSTGNNSLLPQIVKSVLKNNLNIIISGLNSLEKEKLLATFPILKGKSIIEHFIQAEEILPFCKLTICHGGSGTVYQSLESGIPVLCFPKNPDQGLVSMAVSQKNIGRYLSKKTTNQASIDDTILDCISNELILQNVQNMQKELQQWNTKKHWENFLSRFKTIRKAKKVIA